MRPKLSILFLIQQCQRCICTVYYSGAESVRGGVRPGLHERSDGRPGGTGPAHGEAAALHVDARAGA